MSTFRRVTIVALAFFTFACGINLDHEGADQSCLNDSECGLISDNTCNTCGSFPTSDAELIERFVTSEGCFAPPVCEPLGTSVCRAERCVIKIGDAICDAPNENCRCDVDDPLSECD